MSGEDARFFSELVVAGTMMFAIEELRVSIMRGTGRVSKNIHGGGEAKVYQ